MLSDNSKTLLADANSTGVVCRRNNKAYGATAADRYNYPSGLYVTPVTAGTGASACVATPRFKAVPRHYWKTSVEWCSNQIAASSPDQWHGYGDIAAVGGTCQSFKDAAHPFPRFYQFGADPGTDNYGTAAFTRVDLDFVNKPNYTHTFKDDTGASVTINRTFAQEAENYANWFAYYRTRIQAVKSVTSLAFLGKTLGQFNVDNQFRVGFHTLSNNPTSTFVDVKDFDLTQKTKWATQLYAIEIALNKETPNLDAIERIGQYFLTGASAALSGSTDPIVLSCQKNWHMLFTDGITNQPALPTITVGNVDNKVPALPLPVTGLTTGADWPPPFRENSGMATTNSASDYTTYYWAQDMRASGAMGTNNVPASTVDPATWQHLNFAAMSLGTEGKLAAGNQAAVESQLKAGTLQWTDPYPTVNKPDASGVDDLWHASINARGQFVNADDADELQAGMGRILADVLNSAGSRGGAAFQGVNLSGTNNHIYRVKFEPGWGGSLAKVLIDPKTGAEISQDWEASAQLATQLLPTVAVPTPWFSNRRVVTMVGTTPKPFLWANLTAAQQDSLAPGNPTRGQLTLEYLRGSKLNEGTKAAQFRDRNVLLGDIVNSQAVYVGKPNQIYAEPTNPGYAAFKSSARQALSDARLYVGANDGMMHAFNDVTGDETFAYIPASLFRPPASAGLGALTFQSARLPRFKHHYYVDSTPRVVDFHDGSAWRTILIGGLGKGGKSYYAIDVTKPTDITDEATAASKVMWEFTDADLGYTYGRVTVAKTREFGGKWLVIVPSGHNNASGVGKVWFLDAATGIPVGPPISTGVGTPTSPAGVSQLSAYTQNSTNLLADQVYFGDLLGNFWRIDLINPATGASLPYASWKAEKLARLTEKGTGSGQPVTTPPQMEIDIVNGFDRWVFVGTGRLLHDDDLSDSQGQTMYAIRDGKQNLPNPIPTTPLSRADLIEVVDAAGLTSRPDFGWFDDLPPGNRIVIPPQAAISIVAYAAAAPQTDPCLTGQPANIYAREFSFGNSVIDTSDATQTYGDSGQAVAVAEGAVGAELLSVDASSSAPGSLNFDVRIGITQGIDGKLRTIKLTLPGYLSEHRMSWRLLGE
jgi:type IV pilus assembly protein PilY1